MTAVALWAHSQALPPALSSCEGALRSADLLFDALSPS